MNNYKRITGHVYSIKNQNGFNNALYDYFGIGIDSYHDRESFHDNRVPYLRGHSLGVS
jgi:hypothetical protein